MCNAFDEQLIILKLRIFNIRSTRGVLKRVGSWRPIAKIMKERIYRLEQLTELRVEVDSRQELNICLKSGNAEVFGTELKFREPFYVTNKLVSIYTHDGCVLALKGQLRNLTEFQDTPMMQYYELHCSLETRRREAKQHGRFGPRTIILGDTDSGKSTLCRILANYGVRTGWTPTYVDLDIGQGSLSPPGCIVATQMNYPISLIGEYPLDTPFAYFYGHSNPCINPQLYKLMIENLASSLERKSLRDWGNEIYSGWIINTMGWTTGLGYTLLLHAIKALKVDLVIINGDTKLSKLLKSKLKHSNPPIMVRSVPVSSGVQKRSKTYRKRARFQRILDYFYGIKKELRPYTHTTSIQDFKLYKIGPMNSEDEAKWLEIKEVPIDDRILNRLIAVSHARNFDELPYSTIAGYIQVRSIRTVNKNERGMITFLAPCPDCLPGKLFLIGSID